MIKIALAVLETIKEVGSMGAPGGHIYAALMAQGITLEQYEQIMNVLVNSKLVRKVGHCYFMSEKFK